MDKLRCEWVIQIGAFGEHRIVAEKKSKNSHKVSLSIDDNLVVRGAAADIGCAEWSADIAIQGKLTLNYNLNKTNSNGVATNQTTTVTKRLLHSNSIRVTVPDLRNLATATLECDEVCFSQLKQHKDVPTESPIHCSLEAFEGTQGISVPYAPDGESCSGGFAAELADLVPGGDGLLNMLTSYWWTPAAQAA